MINPARTLMSSFFIVIIVGTFLLMLPISSTGSVPLSFLSALFTASSAVCVTGLSVIDVAVRLTLFGKIVLLVLIQIGGLGIMVFSFFALLSFKKKLSIKDSFTVAYMVSEDNMTDLLKVLRVIIFSTFLIEGISACFLFAGFSRSMGISMKTLWYAVFHAISAFCNAGFALFSDNLESFTTDTAISVTISITILLAGMSFAVLHELAMRMVYRCKNMWLKKRIMPPLSLNTYVVLLMTFTLLAISFTFFYLLEHGHAMKDFSLGTQYTATLFQAVTLRTAGFSTIPFSKLTNATLLFMIFIMFIGGAAGGTAGGIKLNTLAVVIAFFKSFLNNRNRVVLKNMSIPEEQVKKSFLILGFGLSVVSAGIFILTITEPLPFLYLVFETVSAFATVGLSVGITASLSPLGQMVIIVLMFIGRVGPLTILTAAGKKQKDNPVEYPYGSIAIG